MCSITENDPSKGGDFACAQSGCRACQDALVRAHSGLIHTLLQQVAHAGVPYAELVQAGRLALWRAALHFDPQRGVQFATYAGVAVERALWATVHAGWRASDLAEPVMAAPESGTPLSQLFAVRSAVQAAVAQLPTRLQAVVRALYGLDGQEPCTQVALGRAWGVSGERIRQLHVQALVILRHPGLSADLYALCAPDGRAAYLQALRHNRTWQRRRRR
jgi:RNA polymerase sigma factor (sigma-70 family)